MAHGLPGFGQTLRRLRRDRQLTQEALAERAGVSARAVSDLERGVNRSPQRFTAERLADALGLAGPARDRFLAEGRPASLPGPPDDVPGPVASTLPVPRGPLLGRSAELAEIALLLARPGVRLVTVTGTAGVGKTHLAIQLATDLRPRYPDGVAFVSLATVTDARLVEAAVSRELQARHGPAQPVVASLAARRSLLVLDNYEQLLPDVAFLQRVLDACPGVSILVTSRAPLHLACEVEVPLGPLPVAAVGGPAPDPAAVEDLAVVQLFAQRARLVNPRFHLTPEAAAAIAEIAATLDGLPLAIELAAARSRLLSPLAILRRLDRRVQLLTGALADSPERHASLRSALDWSYDLLDLTGQHTFRSLAVFPGGLTPGLATRFLRDPDASPGHLAGDFAHDDPDDPDDPDDLDGLDDLAVLDRIAALVERSLLVRRDDPDGEPRFSMLPTIRAYALDRLAAEGELPSRRADLIRVVARLTRAAEPGMTGPGQLGWFRRLEAEHANIRQALHWALEDDPETAVAMAGHLVRFWEHQSHLDEGRQWLAEALASPAGLTSPQRGKLLWGQGTLSLLAGAYEQAVTHLTEGVAAARAAGDLYHAAFALNTLGSVTGDLGDVPRARALHQEGLELMRAVGDPDGIAALLGNLGYDAILLGDYDEAIARCRESLEGYRRLDSAHGIASMLTVLGRATLLAGLPGEARHLFREGLRRAADLGNRVYAVDCLQGLASVAATDGEWVDAATLFGVVERLSREAGYAIAPYLRDADDRARRAIIDAIGMGPYASARDAGHAMSLDEALIRATAHLLATGHPIVKSFEKGEHWLWCYLDDVMIPLPEEKRGFWRR